MRMARVNVYLPDDLAERVKEAGLNISGLTQAALRSALAARHVDEWLDDLMSKPSLGVSHDAVLLAVTAAKDEFEHGG